MCIRDREKMTEGRSAWESFGAVGAKFQKEQGIDIDPAQLRDEIYRAADWRVDPCSIETYVNRSGEVADFWQDMLCLLYTSSAAATTSAHRR